MTDKRRLPFLAALVAALLVGCAPAPLATPPAERSTPLGLAPATETPTAPQPTETATVPSPTPAPFPNINWLRMVDDSDGWASDPDGKLYRTSDGGSSWSPVATPEGVAFTAYAGAFLDAKTAWLPYADPNGAQALLKTTDGGMTWTPLTGIGLENLGGQASFEFSSPNDGLATVAGVGAGNLYLQEFETHDGGANFKVIPLVGLTNEQGLPEGTVHLCNICTDAFHYDPSRAIIVEGDMATMQPRGAVHVHQSTDLGQHWSESSLPLPAGYQDALVWGLPLIFPGDGHGFLPVRLLKYNADNSTAYDVIAIYETPDGGATWSLTPTVLTGVNPATLTFSDDFDGVALCGSQICATHDAAHTWQTITPDLDLSNTDTRYVLQMSFIDPSIGWIIISENEQYQLYKTTDGGSSWTKLTP